MVSNTMSSLCSTTAPDVLRLRYWLKMIEVDTQAIATQMIDNQITYWPMLLLIEVAGCSLHLAATLDASIIRPGLDRCLQCTCL
jgi:hypothetical protein